MSYTREKFKVYAWDKTGTSRRTLPQECVGDGTSWTDDRDGGYSAGALNVQYRDDDQPDLQPGDRVEFWYDDLRRYRGYIRRINISPSDTNRVTYQLAGVMQIAGTNPVTKRYAGGFDVSQIAAKMVQDTLLKPGAVLQEGLQVNTSSISVASDGADFYGQALYDALRGLNEQAAKAAAWGSSVDGSGRDEFYFRPISPIITPDHTIILPTDNVSEASSDVPLEDVINEVQVISNIAPKYPNLIFNPGFERPVLTGASGVNLFRNGDFEEDDTYWDLQGGADIKTAGADEGSPFSGSKMAEIDSGDEVVLYDSTPAVAVVPGATYRFAFRAKREIAQLTPPAYGATYTLGFTDGGGLMAGYREEDLLDDDDTVYNSVVWKRWEWQAVAPAGATGVYFKMDGQPGLDTGDGILIDAIECFDVSEVYQEGWEVIANGTSTVESVDWACEDAHEGGYSVSLTVTADDSDADEVYLVQKGGAKFSVIGGQTLRFLAHLKCLSGETSPKFRLYIQSWNSNQESLGITSSDVTAGTLTNEWQYFSEEVALPQTAASGLAWLSVRGDGTLLVDSLRCSDGAYADEVGGIDVYIPDGNYISPVFKAVELFGPGGAAGDNSDPADQYYDVYNSAAYYGRRIKLVQVNDISSTDAAQSFAIEWLKSNAIAYPSPSITMVNPTVFYLPGQCVRLVGANGRKLYTGGLPVARVSYSFGSGTGLTSTIQLAREVRDEANLIQRLIERNARRGVTPAISYSGASPGSAAGASWSGGSLPTGGDTDEALLKLSATDGDADWAPVLLPSNYPRNYPSLLVPEAADFTWLNQGTATASDEDEGMTVWCPREPGGGINVRGLYVSTGTTFTATLGCLPVIHVEQYPETGVFCRASNTGNFITWKVLGNNGSRKLEVVRHNSVTALDGVNPVPFSTNWYPSGYLTWLRVRGDGTNFFFDISENGRWWVRVHTIAMASGGWGTSVFDQAGIFLTARNTTRGLMNQVCHWEKLTTFETARTFYD